MSHIKNKILIIGHRGAYNEAPENSLEGFKKAIELGADYIEFDVHKTLDGELVIIHDENTLRMTGYDARVKDIPLKELKKLKLPNKEQIPTLQELINITKGKINFLCELKADGMCKKVLSVLTQNNMISSTIFQSFNVRELLNCQKTESNINWGPIVPKNENYLSKWSQREKMIQEVLDMKASHIITRFKNVNKKFVDYCHDSDLSVFVYPINSKLITKRYTEFGVDGLIVNNISQTIDILKQE